MREIKFRAWHKKNETMIEFGLTNIYADSYAGENWISGGPFTSSKDNDWDNLILMQYTGLKDKDGKEIYEGDIVENDGIAVVRYNGNQFVIESPGSLAIDYVSEYFFETCIVIGNQFQNPELLS
jgi:uncharacterized phage protein (TIGR01671 family)